MKRVDLGLIERKSNASSLNRFNSAEKQRPVNSFVPISSSRVNYQVPVSKAVNTTRNSSMTSRNSSNRKLKQTGVSVRNAKTVQTSLVVSRISSNVMLSDASLGEQDIVHAVLKQEKLEHKL